MPGRSPSGPCRCRDGSASRPSRKACSSAPSATTRIRAARPRSAFVRGAGFRHRAAGARSRRRRDASMPVRGWSHRPARPRLPGCGRRDRRPSSHFSAARARRGCAASRPRTKGPWYVQRSSQSPRRATKNGRRLCYRLERSFRTPGAPLRCPRRTLCGPGTNKNPRWRVGQASAMSPPERAVHTKS